MAATLEVEELAEWLAATVASLRGRQAPPWSELDIRECRPLVMFGLQMRRFELVFALGPLSNQYPTTSARAIFDALPALVQFAVDGDVLDGRARGFVGRVTRLDEADNEQHLTLRATLPLTLELR